MNVMLSFGNLRDLNLSVLLLYSNKSVVPRLYPSKPNRPINKIDEFTGLPSALLYLTICSMAVSTACAKL